jgi:predicted metal-dependent phosphotriesterase family hydrolase
MSYIQTVRGATVPEKIGFTLVHEHLHLEMWHASGDGRIGQVDDDEIFAAELAAFKSVGGSCLVDQTPRGGGRQPERLRELSTASGVEIVCSTGYYTEPYYPPEDVLQRRSVSEIAELFLDEIQNGIAGTGIRPGLIGEIGTSQGWVSPLEERVHRAAARAQRASGLPLATHTLYHKAGQHQLDIFAEEGVDPARICIGHCDTFPSLAYCESIASRGAYVSLDNIGYDLPGHEDAVRRLLLALVERGYARQVLLSQDMGQLPELGCRGGRGLTYLAKRFLPSLLEAGLDAATIRLMTIENPTRWLTIDRAPNH